MTTSEDRYWEAYRLYNEIKADFYEIENNNPENLDELIDKTIDNTEEALKVIDGIDMKVVKKLFAKNIYALTKNVETFKEQADYVLTILRRVKRYPGQRNPLPPEMYDEEGKKNWKKELNKQKGVAKRSKYWETETEFDDLEEGFISFSTYIKNKKQYGL